MVAEVEGTLFELIFVRWLETVVIKEIDLLHGGVLLSFVVDSEETAVLKIFMDFVFVLAHQDFLTPPHELAVFVNFV